MELDARTLIVIAVLNASFLGGLAVAFSGRHDGTHPIGLWGTAIVTLAVGLAGIGLRGIIPDLFSITVANSVCIGALGMALYSLRVFRGYATRDPYGWGILTAVFVLVFLFTHLTPSFQARVAVVSIALALFMARCALTLHFEVPRESWSSYRFTELVFWLAAVAALARAVLVLGEPREALPAATELDAMIFLFYASFITVATLGVMWMGIQELQRELVRSARYDSLTGVLNRGAFLAEFTREESRSEREGRPFSLAIFDLDRFKAQNDRYGHPVGDQMLQEVVGIMRLGIRRHDVIGRYGGEEFALLMPNTGKDTALRVAERVRHEVEQKGVTVAGERVALTISGGVATYQVDGHDWDSLLSAADTALYAAKDAGRNLIQAAEPAAVSELATGD